MSREPAPARSESRLRVPGAVVAVLALAAGLLAALVTAAPAQAANGCRAEVDYTVTSDWGSGFQAQVTIHNTGDAPIDGWAVTLRYPQPVKVSSGWNLFGPHFFDPNTVTFTNLAWNAVIAPGGQTWFGFVASGGGGTPSITMTSGGAACALES